MIGVSIAGRLRGLPELGHGSRLPDDIALAPGFFAATALLVLGFAAAASAAPEPMRPEKAFRYEATAEGADIVVRWTIEPGYYLYRERMSFATEDAGRRARPRCHAGRAALPGRILRRHAHLPQRRAGPYPGGEAGRRARRSRDPVPGLRGHRPLLPAAGLDRERHAACWRPRPPPPAAFRNCWAHASDGSQMPRFRPERSSGSAPSLRIRLC